METGKEDGHIDQHCLPCDEKRQGRLGPRVSSLVLGTSTDAGWTDFKSLF